MNITGVKQHYIRGIKTIVEILNNTINSNDIPTDFTNCMINIVNKIRFDCSYSYFDINNMLVLCAISLMGLNREKVENINNIKNYSFNVNYPFKDYKSLIKKIASDNHMTKNEAENYVKSKNDIYSFFNDKRNISTMYDPFLFIDNYDKGDKNYLKSIRNSFMHSNYNINIEDKKFENIIDITNDNYTHFEGRIFVPNYLQFVKFYYSNLASYGIMDNPIMIKLPEYKKIENDNDIKDFINNMEARNTLYNNPTNNINRSFEKVLFKKNALVYKDINDINSYTNQNDIFANDCKEKAFLLIKKYFPSFKDMDVESQGYYFWLIAYSSLDFKKLVSSSIMYIYEDFIKIRRLKINNLNIGRFFYNVNATLLILKSYLVLYRIQNTVFEDLNYLDMNKVNYIYSEHNTDGYNEFKQKLINDGYNLSETEYQNRFFTEIFRDALAHGNISYDIEEKDNLIKEYLIFDDIRKSKSRSIKISFEELYKYLLSPCFSIDNVKTKELSKSRIRK